MSETLRMELFDIDWDEALAMNAAVDFERRRSDAIHREWPIGTRVRWLQTPNRDVFEAEGVVHHWTARVGEKSRDPWVVVEFTKHPNLDAARLAVSPFVAAIEVRNLERIDG